VTLAVTDSYAVASGHPLAAEAALDALRAGGSAVDAVLAAAFAQWVVNGPMCGPGGDLFVLHDPGDGSEPMVYGGWSRTPMAFPIDGPVESYGARASVVPGSLAGAAAASAGAGRLPWPALFTAAIRLADAHAVTEWMQRSYRSVVDKGHGEALAAFLDQSAAPSAGDVVSCSRFGRTLLALADDGAEGFYRGHLAERIIAASSSAGAYLSARDLAEMTADVRPAIVHELEDVTVVVPPAPSQAGIVPQLMAAVAPELSPQSARYAETTAPIVERELTDRCIVGVPGTASSVATDGVGMAAVVHSLAGVQFGTGWVAGDTGIALGNRVGTSLTTRPDLPAAAPVPGGALPHTLSAAMFRSPSRSVLVATPGGDRQVQWLAQAGQRFRRGESLRDIAAGPRWFVCPEGDRFGVPAGIGSEWFLFGEPDMDWSRQDELAGYSIRRTDSVGGGIQAIERTAAGWTVASDPRSGGAAHLERRSGRV
jgi:gamma-glutamyltranspeptidase